MPRTILAAQVQSIIFACEAGMGISVMTGNWFKRKLSAAGLDRIAVTFMPARDVPVSAQLVVVHRGLAPIVRFIAPEAVIVIYERFSDDPTLLKLINALTENAEIVSSEH